MTRKGRIILAIILALVLITTAITAVLIHQVVQTSRLEELRNEALEELERDLGTYDEQSIVLNQTSKANAEELATLLGAELRITKDGRFAKLTLPEGTTIRDVYANDANLEHIEKMAADYQVRISDLETEEETTGERLPTRPTYSVSDTDYELQTYLDYLNMKDVWSSYTGWGVTVAVIDTGIDTDHPEFAGRISEYSYNATEDKIVKDWTDENGNYDWSLIEDEQGHGTAVTGVLAASMNGDGIVGIAPNVNIIVIKAECDENGTFKRTSDLVFGLYYAIERDVQVINMSFGTYEASNPFAAATQLAVDSDIVCVAAAGNDGTSSFMYPAADPNVIGVGALAADSWELADYSNYGENTNLVAPGTTYTAQMGGGYGTMNGTSLASPVVAGAVALFMQNNPYITVEDVTEVLYASSCDLGDLGRDWTYGFGALDMNAFLLEDRGTITFDMLTDELENLEGLFIKGHTLQELPEPERLYAVFDGWYYDDTFTQEYVYYEDKFYDDITLYAKWVNEDDGVPFTYVELEDGTIEIRSYTGRRRFITIPEKINGKVVSSIGEFAFAGQTRLREVGLPSGLTTIKWYAFQGCSNLVSMYIPENVTSIGEYAFVDNIRLSTIAFTGVSKLKTVGNYAFRGCGKLRTIELPAALESINATAFLGDISLYEIKVQAGNAYFTAPDGVLYNATQSTLVAYPAARGRTYALPEQTISIADCAFAYARIDEVDLSQVQTIGGSAFEGSTLEALFLPDTVVMMGGKAFAGNAELSSVHIGSGLTEIAGDAFSGCSSLHKIEIPAQVVSIGRSAFEGSGLVSVTFASDSRLQSIGETAFSSCSIREIGIPASVAEIGKEAFKNNPLSRVTFPENSELFTIGDSAFFGCYLPAITLPQKLNSIGDMAFAATGLETVNVPASVTTLGNGVFAYCSYITDINIEQGNTVYHDLDGIVYTLDNVTICAFPAGKNIDTYSLESTVRTIQSYSFAGTVYLRHVNIPEGLSIINEYAFIDCGAYTYTLPSTLTNIMEGAFYQNRNLSSIQFPEALVQIAEYAFYRCSSLPYVHIPDNVLQIGRYAFAEDWDLGSITFGENAKIPRLSYGAFAYTGLWSFTVPANVSTMAQGVFVGCPWLSSVTFAENSKLESISAYMFDGCTNLQSITFMPGSKLTSIQAHGLEGMDNLTSVDFGDAKLENIDNFAFRFCYRLSTLNLPSTVKNVGRYAFYGCKSLSELSLPRSLEHIGSYAFLGTNDLDLYLASETMPAYLDENWDHGIRGYYTGVTNVETVGDYKYATLTSGNIAIIEYLGTDKTVDLTTVNLGAPITTIGGSAFEDSTVEIIVLPETLTSIQAEAFRYAPLKSIAIPASVTFIGREAFAYSAIESLTFAENASLATIEQYAFERTDKLTSVAIPASVTTLGTGVFQKSGISSVTFEKGIALEEIPQNAFMGTKLTTVTLPDGVKTVNHNAFRDILTLKTVSFGNSGGIRLLSNVFYNTGLESLHIPANVTYIGEYCFVGLEKLSSITVDENNPNYKSVDGLLLTKSGRKLVTVPAGRTGSLTVPISVEEIGFGAFENTALDEVLFDPNANILTLGYRAFFGAKNLTSIHIPASVVSIDYYAFAYCEKLHTVTFAEDNKLKGIYEGAFCGDINLENIVIPEAIVEISDFAFYGCTKITKLPISDTHNLKGIYDYAFAYTSIGGEFTTPETLIDIGSYAFLGTKITKLTIPDTNKKDLIIGIGAFEDCNKLTEVTLPFIGASYEDEEISWFGYIFGAGAYEANHVYVPESLKTITITDGITFVGVGGFYNCTSLERIDVPFSVSVLWECAFGNTTAKHELLNVITTRYKNLPYDHNDYEVYNMHFGKGLSGNLVLSSDIRKINGGAFMDFLSLLNVVLPDSITELGDNAFAGCSSLKSVNIPEGVKILNWYAFKNCTSLESIALPVELTTIRGSVFANCTALKEISIPEHVVNVGSYAFAGCTSLETISFAENSQLTDIGYQTFHGCSSLKEITIPESVTYIQEAAFYQCDSLESIHIPNSVNDIGASAFFGCSNLSAVYIDDLATWCSILFEETLSNPLYYGANLYVDGSLCETLVIPEDVKSIGKRVFYGCSSLKNVILSEGVTSVEDSAFAFNSSLTEVYVSSTVTSLGNNCFRSCASLKKLTFDEGSELSDIAMSAFSGCASLESLFVPETVTNIGMSAFAGCASLECISFGESSALNNIESYAFYSCENLKKVSLPSQLASIGDFAFGSCSMLVGLVIPENVSHIGSKAFESSLYILFNNSEVDISFEEHNATILVNRDGTVQYRPNTGYNLVELIDGFIFEASNGYRLLAYIGDSDTIALPSQVNGQSYQIGLRYSAKHVIIPESFSTIDSQAFAKCYSLEQITIPDSITYIGSLAFADCVSLTNIDIPQSVTHIESGAFDGCASLREVTFYENLPVIAASFPSNVTIKYVLNNEYTIIDGVVYDKECTQIYYAEPSVEHVSIPDGVTWISDNAFHGCTMLKSVDIPNSVVGIGSGAFYGCTSLESIVIPGGVVQIDSNAFQNCTSLLKIVIPDNVITIGSQAFRGCTALESVSFGENCQLSQFHEYAFADCIALKEVALPASLNDIPTGLFENCASLVRIIFNGNSRVSRIGASAFHNCTSLRSISLPDSVLCIEWHAFSNCASLENVVLNEESCLKSIGSFAFESCIALKEFAVPEGVTEIAMATFQNCPSLSSVTLSNGITAIASSAFANCTSLKSIMIPESVASIEISSFGGCTSLEEIIICGELLPMMDVVPAQAEIRVLQSEKYPTIDGVIYNEDCTQLLYVSPNVSEVVIPYGVESISACAFQNCTSLKQIFIPKSVTGIDYAAFEGCTSLMSVIFEENSRLTEICERAFCGCSSLLELYIPDSVTTIGRMAFYHCTSLKSVQFGKGSLLSAVEESAFEWCTSLRGIVLPESTEFLGGGAFYYCTSLKSIAIPKDITIINGYTFYYCTSLEQVTFDDNNRLSYIDSMAFHNCSSLESITIPNNVTSIGESAFSCCNSLKEVHLSSNLKSIGNAAFYLCSSLQIMVIPEGVTDIGASAFSFCSSMESISLPESLNILGEEALYGCPLFVIFNSSSLDLPFDIHNADVILDRQGNLLARPHDTGYYELDNNFIFFCDQGNYVLRGYIGDNETVILPVNIHGFTYSIFNFRGAKHVIIPSGMTKIGDSAFECSTLLESIVIPSSVEYIGHGAFAYCPSLQVISFAEDSHLASIGGRAFAHCPSLKHVDLGNQKQLLDIGNSAFAYCTSLQSITLPDNLSRINDHTFLNCSSLKEIRIPDSVTFLGLEPFRDCETLLENPEYYFNGAIIIDGWLIHVDASLKYLPEIGRINGVANGVYFSELMLKNAVYNYGASNLSNVQTLVIKSIPLGEVVQPLTLKNIVITGDVSTGDLRNNPSMLYQLRNITIFVEGLEDDLCWDSTFPGWSNGNRVVYGDEWSWVHFYDESGNLLYSEPRLTAGIIRRPYYEIPSDERNDYIFLGWDLDGDGVVDSVPATAAQDIFAKAVVEKRAKTYSVTFRDSETGEIYLQEVLPYGTTIQQPSDPYKEGYIFEGWSGFAEGMTVTGELLFEANWHQHTHQANVTPPTCTEEGYTTYTCHCGDSYVSDYVEPAGHTWSDWYGVALGVEERSCETCGETESRDKTPDFDVDGNGTVEEADLTLLMSILVGNTETDVVFDFDFDGELTIYDGVLLMQQIQ